MQKILVLTDGKAGHENQSRAFVRALGCEADIRAVAFKSLLYKRISYVADHLGLRLGWVFEKLPTCAKGVYAAVVGTGSGTFYAARVMAARLGVKCGVVLYPRGYHLAHFDCVLAPTFDHPRAASNVIAIPANLVAGDEAFYARGVADFTARYAGDTGNAVAVIVGGPNKCSTLSADWMKRHLDAIFAQNKGSAMWVTTSRRTPADVEQVIEQYPWNYKLLYSQDHFNPIPAFVKLAKRLYVTAESTGMLSEACTFGSAEVVALDNLNPEPSKFRCFLDDLKANGYVEGSRKVDLTDAFSRARGLMGLAKMLVAACCLFAGSAFARLELGAPFADGMVVQRGMRVPVWGWADPGEKVTVRFADQVASAYANAQGAWRVNLAPLAASKERRAMRVESATPGWLFDTLSDQRTIGDVVVGEVWYVSGQSNAEFPLWSNVKDNNPRFRDGNGALVAQMTHRPFVRMCYASDYKTSETPRTRAPFAVRWEPFTPASLGLDGGHGFSAMGVYYALELYAALEIPIGVVGSYWGGTRIEPWIPKEGFAAIGFDPQKDDWACTQGKGGERRGACQQPSRLWNEMVNPFAPMAMRGFIWYQGCSNSGDPAGRYRTMMHALYKGWSARFENPELALYFVQLAPWGGGGHPIFQQEQAQFAAEEPHAAMAVINDLGNLTDIHPNQKYLVGKRLAVHALKRDYGFAHIEDDSPTLATWQVVGDRFRLTFEHAKAFYLYNEQYCSQANGFEICGADGVWKPGNLHRFSATPHVPKGQWGRYRGGIDGGPVLEVSAEGVAQPQKIRYLYSKPWKGTIYSDVCLPLGAFAADAADGEMRTFVREAAGMVRLSFAFETPTVTRFDVRVNGAWAGSVAAPPQKAHAFPICMDVPMRAGTNDVFVYRTGATMPKITRVEIVKTAPTAGLETEKWQRAIDAAAAQGGGRVTIPAGRHVVGGLELKSNVELHLEEGAVLEGAFGLDNYRIWSLPCSEGTWSAIVAGVGVTNVAITGRGEIFGNGRAWKMPRFACANQEGLRARGIFFADAKGVRLEDFLLRDAACWGCVFKCVDGIVARNVRIDNHANYNNDGFDIEAKNALFEGCDVDASDDAFVFKSNNPEFVVENILVTNCVARSHCNAYKFGTATHGVMRRVTFADCRALPPRRDFIVGDDEGPDHGVKGKGHWSRHLGYERYPAGCGIASLVVECVDGGVVEDILFENIDISGATVPLFVRGGTRKGRHNAVPAGTSYGLRRITFRNIAGEGAGWIASSISGVKGCRAEDVTLENVHIRCHGAGSVRAQEALAKAVPDVSGGYPEATMFRHILPAFGLYLDQVDNVTLKDVDFKLFDGEEDGRPAIAWGTSAASK